MVGSNLQLYGCFETFFNIYIWFLGNDDYGKILSEKATGAGVTVNYLVHAKEPTGTCAVCITGKHRWVLKKIIENSKWYFRRFSYLLKVSEAKCYVKI